MTPAPAGEPALIKRYAQTRLYDTAAAAYVTVEELRRRVRDGEPVVVIDRDTGEDITRILLA